MLLFGLKCLQFALKEKFLSWLKFKRICQIYHQSGLCFKVKPFSKCDNCLKAVLWDIFETSSHEKNLIYKLSNNVSDLLYTFSEVAMPINNLIEERLNWDWPCIGNKFMSLIAAGDFSETGDQSCTKHCSPVMGHFLALIYFDSKKSFLQSIVQSLKGKRKWRRLFKMKYERDYVVQQLQQQLKLIEIFDQDDVIADEIKALPSRASKSHPQYKPRESLGIVNLKNCIFKMQLALKQIIFIFKQ